MKEVNHLYSYVLDQFVLAETLFKSGTDIHEVRQKVVLSAECLSTLNNLDPQIAHTFYLDLKMLERGCPFNFVQDVSDTLAKQVIEMYLLILFFNMLKEHSTTHGI
jgi:hypothetical protein